MDSTERDPHEAATRSDVEPIREPVAGLEDARLDAAGSELASAEAADDDAPADDVREQEAVLRRMPRVEVFLVIGALLGLLLALALTFVEPITPQLSVKEFSREQAFGFLAIVCVPVGMGVLGLIATFLGRGRGKRVRLVKGDAQSAHEGGATPQAAAPDVS